MQITRELIEGLLWSDEGTSLDFKRDQYPFANATEFEKSEILKDVLAFANAFRREDAFILIGVEDVRGGRGNIIGTPEHIDDAHLQQFVNSKVQRPIAFSYSAIEIDGQSVGVFHIPKQKRPFYAKADYGKVKKDAVYVRRGSSTAIAAPDEIAAMGADQVASHGIEPALEFSFWDKENGVPLGTSIRAHSVAIQYPLDEKIPDYREPVNVFSASLLSTNKHFHRQIAEFVRVRLLINPLSFAISNTGDVTAQDVRLVFEVNDPENKLTFLEESQNPDLPEKQNSHFTVPPLADQLRHKDQKISVERLGANWRIKCLFGKIQPKDTGLLSEVLYIGANESMDLPLDIKMFADNLSRPVATSALVQFAAEKHQATVDDVLKQNFAGFIQARQALENRTGPK